MPTALAQSDSDNVTRLKPAVVMTTESEAFENLAGRYCSREKDLLRAICGDQQSPVTAEELDEMIAFRSEIITANFRQAYDNDLMRAIVTKFGDAIIDKPQIQGADRLSDFVGKDAEKDYQTFKHCMANDVTLAKDFAEGVGRVSYSRLASISKIRARVMWIRFEAAVRQKMEAIRAEFADIMLPAEEIANIDHTT